MVVVDCGDFQPNLKLERERERERERESARMGVR